MISDFWFAISAQRRKMQKRRYFWFSFVELKWKLQLWFSTAYLIYSSFYFSFTFLTLQNENQKIGSISWFSIPNDEWKSENWTYFLIFIFKLKMKNGNHRVISDFLFSNQKRKSELWNSTRTVLPIVLRRPQRSNGCLTIDYIRRYQIRFVSL